MKSRTRSSFSAVEYVDDPNYYRLLYHRAAQRVNEGMGMRTTKGDDRAAQLVAEGLAHAQDALRDVESARERLEGRLKSTSRRRVKESDERLARFLRETVEPCLHVLIAGAYVASGDVKSADRQMKAFEMKARETERSYRVYYNLACYESSRATLPGEAKDQPEWLERALSDLTVAFDSAGNRRRRSELIRWAQKDPALQKLAKGSLKARFDALIDSYPETQPPEAKAPDAKTPPKKPTDARK